MMDFWSSLTSLLNNPLIQSCLISYGTSISLDAVKATVQKSVKNKNESFEFQIYQIFRETFEKFYFEQSLEFEEDIVMTTFFELAEKTKDFSSNNITKDLICNTVGFKLDNQDLQEWEKIFITTCSNPKYQWVYNKLSFPFLTIYNDSTDSTWMDQYMPDNYCLLTCDTMNELPPIFQGITTQLAKKCWYQTKVLIWEIIFNSKEHGSADNCKIYIERDSITVIDDGKEFDPLTLCKEYAQRGGNIAIKKFMDDYPEVKLKHEYYKGRNHLHLDFGYNVFNVNGMNEINVSDLEISQPLFTLKYPKSIFKYYYIDIDSIYKQNNKMLFVTYSGIDRLFASLQKNIKRHFSEDKIFIYFSSINDFCYQMVFDTMCEVLQYYEPRSDNIDIILIKGDTVEN